MYKKALLCLGALFISLGIGYTDPLNYWTQAISGTTNNLNAVIYTNGLFIAVGGSGTILTSPDGANWSAQSSGTISSLAGVAYGQNKYVVVGANNTVLTSSDATNWTVHASATGTNADWNSVCFGNGMFVMAGVRGLSHQNFIYVSTDGITWSQTFWSSTPPTFDTNPGPLYDLSGIVFGNGHFAVMGNGEQTSGTFTSQASAILVSSDGTNWSTAGVSTLANVACLCFASGQFVFNTSGVGSSQVYSSPDTTTWTVSNFPNTVPSAMCGGKDSRGSNIVGAVSATVFYADASIGTANSTWTSYSGAPFALGAMTFGANLTGTGVFAGLNSSNIYYSVIYTGAIVWTNTAGGNWSNPTNWSPNIVPGRNNNLNSYDDAVIAAPGTYTVVMDEPGTWWDLRSLTLGAGSGTQTLAMTSKTLYVEPLTITGGGVLVDNGSTFHAGIAVQNGGQLITTNGTYYIDTLAVNSGGQVTASGNYAWVYFHGNVVVGSGGTLSVPGGDVQVANDGSCTVGANGTVNLAGSLFNLQGPMTNSGTVNVISGTSTASQVTMDNNGTASYQGSLWNLPGGVMTFSGAQPALMNAGYGSQSSFVNQGTVIVNSGPSRTLNAGVFDSTGGTVTNYSGLLTVYAFSNTLAGTFYTANGTTMQFQGGTPSVPLKPGTPLVLTGGGQFQFTSGWLDFPSDIIPNLQLVGGVLELEPGFQGGVITNLALDGITLTNLNLPVTGVLTMTNGSVYGNCTVQSGGQLIASGNFGYATFHGNVAIAGGGMFSDPNGNVMIASDGSFTVAANAVANILASTLYLDGPMTNSGTVNVTAGSTSASQISIENNGTAGYNGSLWNLAGGTVLLNGFQPSSITATYGAQTYFNNQGTVIGAPGSSRTINVGLFDTTHGSVSNYCGAFTMNTFNNTIAGTFYTTNGTTIQFQGGTASTPLQPGVPLVLAGGGVFQFVSGWLDLPTDIVANLQMVGGILQLAPGFQGGAITNLALDGITLTNLALPITNGVFALTNSAVYGNCVVQNGGELIASGSYSTFHGSAMIGAGGALSIPFGSATVAGDGSLTIATNATADIVGSVLYLQGPMTNSGTVNVTSGTSSAAEISIYNNGTPSYQGCLWNLGGGAVSLNGQQPVLINSGYGSQTYVVNQGNVIANGGPSRSIDVGGLTNSGVLTAGSGAFQLYNLTLQSSGTLNVQLNSKSDYGTFAISGNVALTGALSATLGNGYAPAAGDSFQALSYGSYSGNFTSTNLPVLDLWQTTYGVNAVTLQVLQSGLIPRFSTAKRVAGNIIFSGTNGLPGNGFSVLMATNPALPLASWAPLVTNRFDSGGDFSFTNAVDATKPQQFFILKLQ